MISLSSSDLSLVAYEPCGSAIDMAKCFWRRMAAAMTMLLVVSTARASFSSTNGISALANRLLPGHGDAFEFKLTTAHENWSRWNPPVNDNYTVRAGKKRKIRIEGTSLNALARG